MCNCYLSTYLIMWGWRRGAGLYSVHSTTWWRHQAIYVDWPILTSAHWTLLKLHSIRHIFRCHKNQVNSLNITCLTDWMVWMFCNLIYGAIVCLSNVVLRVYWTRGSSILSGKVWPLSISPPVSWLTMNEREKERMEGDWREAWACRKGKVHNDVMWNVTVK